MNAIILGEVLWDCLASGEVLGGAPANLAWHVNDLGVGAHLVNAVGEDEAGLRLRARLDALGIDHALGSSAYPTGAAVVETGPLGNTHFTLRTPAAWDTISLSPRSERILSQAQMIYFGTLCQRSERSRETIRGAVHAFRGRFRAFDVNLRPPHDADEFLSWGLCHCDVLKFSSEEAPRVGQIVLGSTDGEGDAVAQACFEQFGMAVIIETMGASGARAWSREGKQAVAKAIPVDIIDTVGAGDAAFAAFMAALLHDKPLHEALFAAVTRGGQVCATRGAILCK